MSEIRACHEIALDCGMRWGVVVGVWVASQELKIRSLGISESGQIGIGAVELGLGWMAAPGTTTEQGSSPSRRPYQAGATTEQATEQTPPSSRSQRRFGAVTEQVPPPSRRHLRAAANAE